MNNPAYLLWIGGSILLSFGFFLLLGRGCNNRGRLAAVALVPTVLLGMVCSKLLYMLLQLDYVLADGWDTLLLSASPEHFSFIGGILGVCLAILLAAKLVRVPPMKALNAFAPAGLLLAALARFGEGFLAQEFMTGTGPYIEEGSPLCFFPIAVNCSVDPEWQEWYLSVFLIEGVLLLVAAVVSLLCFRKGRFIRSLFLLCLPQVICENLLNNIFWWIFCIRVEQLLYMVVMTVILIIYAVRARGWKYRLLPVMVAAACAGLFIVAEFAMEQKIECLSFLSVRDCYMLMGLGTAALLFTEIFASRKAHLQA